MKKILTLIIFATMFGRVMAQNDASHLEPVANSFLTELYNSNLTSYVRIIGSNLTSSNNGFQIKMALIAFKDSSKWNTAENYLQSSNRFLRYTQVSAGVTHQSKNDDATLQLTFTLYNGRDSSVFVYRNPINQAALNTLLRKAWDQYYHDLLKLGKTDEEATKMSNEAFNSEYTYLNQRKSGKNPTPTAYMAILNDLFKKSPVFGGNTADDAVKNWNKDFTDYAKKISRMPLLTLYPYGYYDYTYTGFDKVGLGLTFLYSLDHDVNHNPLQLDIEGNVYFANDSTFKTVNLNQKIGSLSVGVNRVMAVDGKGQSTFEMAFSGQIQHNSEMNAKQKTPAADLTFKYKLFKNFWIPLDIKYDSSKKSIFGFLSITSNLGKP